MQMRRLRPYAIAQPPTPRPPFSDAERWPAGDYPLQSNGGSGLPMWTSANRSVYNTDVVIWHSFGITHIVRPEDFPVMPVEVVGFVLKPMGFFAMNPTVDVPPGGVG